MLIMRRPAAIGSGNGVVAVGQVQQRAHGEPGRKRNAPSSILTPSRSPAFMCASMRSACCAQPEAENDGRSASPGTMTSPTLSRPASCRLVSVDGRHALRRSPRMRSPAMPDSAMMVNDGIDARRVGKHARVGGVDVVEAVQPELRRRHRARRIDAEIAAAHEMQADGDVAVDDLLGAGGQEDVADRRHAAVAAPRVLVVELLLDDGAAVRVDADAARVGVAHRHLDAGEVRDLLHAPHVRGAEAGDQHRDGHRRSEDVLELEAAAAEVRVVRLVRLQRAVMRVDRLVVDAQVHVLRMGVEVVAQRRQALVEPGSEQQARVADRAGGEDENLAAVGLAGRRPRAPVTDTSPARCSTRCASNSATTSRPAARARRSSVTGMLCLLSMRQPIRHSMQQLPSSKWQSRCARTSGAQR